MSLDALTKKANGLMAHIYSHLYSLPATGLRFFTVYGPGAGPTMAPMLFARAILAGEPIQVFNQGRMQRDFTSIDDIVEGVVRYSMTTTATPLIQSGATKGGSSPTAGADTTALEVLVGFRPTTPIETGMEWFADWYRGYFVA